MRGRRGWIVFPASVRCRLQPGQGGRRPGGSTRDPVLDEAVTGVDEFLHGLDVSLTGVRREVESGSHAGERESIALGRSWRVLLKPERSVGPDGDSP